MENPKSLSLLSTTPLKAMHHSYKSLYMEYVNRHEIGLFTAKPYQKGMVVEWVPYSYSNNEPTRYVRHSFYDNRVNKWLMLLGYGNFYRSNQHYNVDLDVNLDIDVASASEQQQVLPIVATQDIPEGAELILNPTTIRPNLPSNIMQYYDDIYLDTSTLDGVDRGVFANRNFDEGDTIEIAPFIKDPFQKQGQGFEEYTFGSTIKDDSHIFVMGYGSLYNHSYDYNVTYSLLYDYEVLEPYAEFFIFKACKQINKGDELYINYGEDYWSNREIKPSS